MHRDRATRSKNGRESLYRTKWLIAHNALDAIARKSPAWRDYLKKLRSAEEVAKKPA